MARRPLATSSAASGDPLNKLLGYQLRRASSVVMSTLAEDLAHLGLSVVEASVLLVIADNPGMTQSEVGRVLEIHRANMVPMVTKLFARALVDKQQGPGRGLALSLTAQGHAAAKGARQTMARHDARMLPNLSPSQRAALVGWLEAIWRDATG
jgi:DNA-binding MarR family transcriptional regulator